MRGAWAICKRELHSYFVSPVAYALMAVFWLAESVFFVAILNYWVVQGRQADVRAEQLGPDGNLLNVPAMIGTSFLDITAWLLVFILPIVAMALLAKSKGYNLKQLTTAIEPALREAGVIILITAAGGAFGGMLKETGIGKTISDMVTGYVDGGEATWGLGILLIFIAWGSAAVMKIAQGSGTVAVITAAGIMAGVLAGLDEAGVELPYHKIYIFAAISFGAKVISWMNDSGYWVVCKMSGFTEKETLKTWTAQLAAMGVFGLVEVLILSYLFPLA